MTIVCYVYNAPVDLAVLSQYFDAGIAADSVFTIKSLSLYIHVKTMDSQGL